MIELHLLFEVGGVEYALAAAEVLQVQPLEALTPVPGAAPHVAGLLQARGRVIPVIDLRRRFGAGDAERGAEARVIVTHAGQRTVGLLADRAREVIHVDPAEATPPPELVRREGAGFVRAVARAGERLLMLVDLAQVIGVEPGVEERASA